MVRQTRSQHQPLHSQSQSQSQSRSQRRVAQGSQRTQRSQRVSGRIQRSQSQWQSSQRAGIPIDSDEDDNDNDNEDEDDDNGGDGNGGIMDEDPDADLREMHSGEGVKTTFPLFLSHMKSIFTYPSFIFSFSLSERHWRRKRMISSGSRCSTSRNGCP